MTEALRVHHAALGPDGTFARTDEVIRVDDEPSHDELCRREQQVFLDAIHGRVDLEAHWPSAADSLRIVLAADQSLAKERRLSCKEKKVKIMPGLKPAHRRCSIRSASHRRHRSAARCRP